MTEQVLHPYNFYKAVKQVIANKGSAGVDGLKTSDLESHLHLHKPQLLEDVRTHRYTAQPILGVAIPKGNGKTRLLGVPTTTDRVLQQAVSQVLTPLYEPQFSANSYGFRPRRNARQAVGKALEYIHEGYTNIVDIDLKTFFDEVDHCLLLNLLHQKVKCRTTMWLIRKWLRAPIQINGKLRKRRKGMPQGSPLSPLLSNILLNELDQTLHGMQLRFVRYADDFSIYVKSKTEARRIHQWVINYLKTQLKLPVNTEKSGTRRPVQFGLLGFGFVPDYGARSKGRYQLVISNKAWQRLKQNLKATTRKTTPMSFNERISKLLEIQRGWLNYFRGTNILGKLRKLDGWLRNRLRYCIWSRWISGEKARTKKEEPDSSWS